MSAVLTPKAIGIGVGILILVAGLSVAIWFAIGPVTEQRKAAKAKRQAAGIHEEQESLYSSKGDVLAATASTQAKEQLTAELGRTYSSRL